MRLDTQLKRYEQVTTYLKKRTATAPGRTVYYRDLIHLAEAMGALTSNESLDALIHWISTAEDAQILKPIKGKGMTGTQPDCYLYYRVQLPPLTLSESEVLAFQAFFDSLPHPLPSAAPYYEANLLAYAEDKDWLVKLGTRLSVVDLSIPLSINQRSYELFGHEKMISEGAQLTTPEAKAWTRLLKRCQLSGDVTSLNYEDRPSLPTFIPLNSDGFPFFILENKDPFLTVLQLLQTYPTRWALSGLIFGHGKMIESSFSYLHQPKPSQALLPLETTYVYAGDLDVEGLAMFERLVNRYPSANLRYAEGYVDALTRARWTTGRDSNQTLMLSSLPDSIQIQLSPTHLGELAAFKLTPQEAMSEAHWVSYLDAYFLRENTKSNQTEE